MKLIKKTAVSFILTLLLFTAFTIISYSTLFNLIESKFYNQKIILEKEQKIEKTLSGIEKYIASKLELTNSIASEIAIKNSFLVNQSREDIFRRENIVASLIKRDIDFSFMRVIDEDGKIHYSSNQEDIKASDERKITYKMADETSAGNYLKLLEIFEEQKIIFKADSNHHAFISEIYDNFGIKRGYLFLYLGENDIKKFLTAGNILEKNSVIGYPGNKSIVINLADENPEILQDLDKYWMSGAIVNPYPLYADDENNGFSVISSRWKNGYAGYVLPDESFKINSIYRYVLLVSAFSIFFIIIFLVMNLRQDKITIIADRIKRFQINFLIEYLENKSDIEWKKWKKELESRKEEVKKEFKKGLRGIKGTEKESTVNELIDKSWDEIISLLSGHLEKKQELQAAGGVANLQIGNIEEIIRRIITSEKDLRLKTEVLTPVKSSTAAVLKDAGTSGEPEGEVGGELEEFEELEELEELEEMAEASGEPEGEVGGELEEFEELEEMAEASGEPAGEVGGELEEFEELEEMVEASGEPEREVGGELEEFEELEELEEMAEASGELGAASADDTIEKLNNLDNLEELDSPDEAIPEEAVVAIKSDEKTKFSELVSVYKDYGEEIISVDEVQKTIAEIEKSLIPITDGEDEKDIEKLVNFKNLISVSDIKKKSEEQEPELLEELSELEELEETGAEARDLAEEPEAADANLEELGELEEVEQLEDNAEYSGVRKSFISSAPDQEKELLDELETVEDIKPLINEEKYETLETLETTETDESDDIRSVEYIKDRYKESYRKQNYMPDSFHSIIRQFRYEEISGLAENALLEEINGHSRESIESLSFSDKIETLLKQGLVEIENIENAFAQLYGVDSPVIDKDGVFEINQELYTGAPDFEDKELKQLIDKVVDRDENDINVSNNFFTENVDLPVFSDFNEILSPKSNDTKKEKIDSKFGFDFDYLYEDYSGDKSVAVMRLLLKITREIGSFFGAIIVQDEASYYPETVVGLEKNIPGLLSIKKKEALYKELLADRKILFFKTEIKEIDELKCLFSAGDIEKIKSLLFLPIRYKGKKAYLVSSPDKNLFTVDTLMLKVKNLQK